MNAAKKIILLLWLLLAASLGNVSALTPGTAETCVWQKSLAPLATRQAGPLQTAGGHQENEGAGYDVASASLLAAETTAARTASGDFYSVAFETELSPTSYPGVSRYMHFKEANTALDAAMNADADFAATMDQLGISVPRSSSGSILGTSPENWVWHHDTEAGIMQLVPKSQHPNIPGGIFWETMHPGGNGGFSIWGQ